MKKTAIIKRIVLTFVLLAFFRGLSGADIYSYVDKDGIRHFTDSPTKEEILLYIKKSPEESKASSYSSDQYDHIIIKASREHGVAYSLIKALIKVESNFNPKAISRMGAKGLMQIMPKNMKDLDIMDPFDPYENIMGGTRYIKQMLKRFDGRLVMALAAYNAGPTVVEKYNNIPPYKETRHFVDRVIQYTFKYR